jgi:hypothetical protein
MVADYFKFLRSLAVFCYLLLSKCRFILIILLNIYLYCSRLLLFSSFNDYLWIMNRKIKGKRFLVIEYANFMGFITFFPS